MHGAACPAHPSLYLAPCFSFEMWVRADNAFLLVSLGERGICPKQDVDEQVNL